MGIAGAVYAFLRRLLARSLASFNLASFDWLCNIEVTSEKRRQTH